MVNNLENKIVSKNNLITICPLINDKEFINDGFKIQAAHWMMQDRLAAASGTPVPKVSVSLIVDEGMNNIQLRKTNLIECVRGNIGKETTWPK